MASATSLLRPGRYIGSGVGRLALTSQTHCRTSLLSREGGACARLLLIRLVHMFDNIVDRLCRNHQSSRAEVVAEEGKASLHLPEKRFDSMCVQTHGRQDRLYHRDGSQLSSRRVCSLCGPISLC